MSCLMKAMIKLKGAYVKWEYQLFYRDANRSVDFTLMLLIVFVAKYQTAKPDEALIISGSYLGSKMYTKMKVTTKSKSCEEAERSSAGFPTFESNQSIIQQIGRFYSRSVYRTRCTGDV